MSKPLSAVALALCFVCPAARGQTGRHRPAAGHRPDLAPLVYLDSTRERDGLRGPVRRVESEVAKVEVTPGGVVQKSRSLLERTIYDERGRRVANETYPVAGEPGGQEVHRYDAQGNLIETMSLGPGGAVLKRIVYDYEFDQYGNWVKMTASTAGQKADGLLRPVEVTNRKITYFAAGEADDDETQTAAGVLEQAPPEAEAAGSRVAHAGAGGARAESPRRRAANELVEVGALNGRATSLPDPAFPVGAERLVAPVVVKVEVIVDPSGRVVEALATDGPQALRGLAEAAARRATFFPFYVKGRPVKARGSLSYKFNYLP